MAPVQGRTFAGPAEIYRILRDIPEVVEALAVNQHRDNDPAGRRLVLLVVLRAGEPLDGALVARIRRRLAERGSAALVPDVVIRLDELPLTDDGKPCERAAREAVNGWHVEDPALRNPACLAALAAHPALRESTGAMPGSVTDLREQLTSIWEHRFGFSPIGIDEDFFELGGQSILAAQIVADLREITGRNLRLSSLVRTPTIRGLAALAHAAARDPFSPIVTLREGSRSRPFFLVHGLGGNVLDLVPLSQALRTARAVLALQARGLVPGREPHRSVQGMAADYVEEVRRIQPLGPYAIAGFSFGGLVAFEMTQILHARGETVEFLGLIDTFVPEHALPLAARASLKWRQLRRDWRELRSGRDRGRSARRHAEAIGLFWRRLPAWLRLRRPTQTRWPLDPRLPPRLRQVREAAILAFGKYRPRRYAGRVVLFRAASRAPGFPDPLPTWKRVARGGLDTVSIPSDHLGLIQEPAVWQLAAGLDRYLEPRACLQGPAERQGLGEKRAADHGLVMDS